MTDHRPPTQPSPELVSRFVSIVGAPNAVINPEPSSPFLNERRGVYHGAAAAILRPGSVKAVAAILRLANETGTAIVPQGGNSGLVGGQVPDSSGGEIVVALDRLNTIRNVDAPGDAITVDAGVTLGRARAAADAVDRLFPLAIGSMEHCQIGGNVSSNAGGIAVLSYGSMRNLVLGLEVTLPNGDILNGLRALRKDNAGYDLKQIFIGAEGTLGIITGATLKLFPKPRGKATAFVGLTSPDDALALFHVARDRVSHELTSFEMMPRICLDFSVRHLEGAADPLPGRHGWYVLIELSSGRSDEAAREDLEAILHDGRQAGLVADAVIPEGDAERSDLWRIRFSLSDVQRPEGVSIKHDISVPISAIPDFIAVASEAVVRLVPGCRPVPFGHLGDGNLHFNISQPKGTDGAAFRAREKDLNRIVFALVEKYRGSIAAEHGVGQMKKDLLPTVRSEAEMDAMRRIKAAFDPNGIMNPGKVL